MICCTTILCGTWQMPAALAAMQPASQPSLPRPAAQVGSEPQRAELARLASVCTVGCWGAWVVEVQSTITTSKTKRNELNVIYVCNPKCNALCSNNSHACTSLALHLTAGSIWSKGMWPFHSKPCNLRWSSQASDGIKRMGLREQHT